MDSNQKNPQGRPREDTEQVWISLHREVIADVDRLVTRGLYGSSRAEILRSFIYAGVRQVHIDFPWLLPDIKEKENGQRD